MTYCTQADLEARLPDLRLAELSADSGSTPDAAVIALVLADADALIDGYLMGRYTTPVTSPTTVLDTLRVHARNIAVWDLFQRRFIRTLPEGADKSYERTLKFLERLQEGKGALSGAAEVTVSTTLTDAGIAWGSATRVFEDESEEDD